MIKESNTPLSDKEIKNYEEKLNIIFPEEYKNFLSIYNGGIPEKDIFDYGYNDFVIDTLFGFCEDKYKSMIRYNKVIYINRIPENTICVGNDTFGNLILLSVKGPDYGKVYFWDHEMEAAEGETPDYSNLTLIADSFDEFINNLKSVDEIED